MRANANWAGRTAAAFTAVAHRRAPMVRWGVMVSLFAVWLAAGYVGWMAQSDEPAPADALYRTLAAVGLDTGLYDSKLSEAELTAELQLARFAGFLAPLIGLVFAFSGQLGQSVAHLFRQFAAHHVVIVGDGPDALALALDCVRAGDVVALVGERFAEETAYDLRLRGVLIVEGDAARAQTLRAARAPWARRVVILAGEDAHNLRIEAAASAAARRIKRRAPLVVHVALRSTLLLDEARAMRAHELQRLQSQGREKRPAVDARPFSLEEIGARLLLAREAGVMLDLAAQTGQERLHLVLFGFDPAAEAVAVRALMSLWSIRFGAPRLTVLTPDPDEASARFDARFPQARAHAIWKADIEFLTFDWRRDRLDEEVLEAALRARGPASAFVVSTGQDAQNIALSLALRRACNVELAPGRPLAPAPIYMKESSASEFSKLYAAGDTTEKLDAYLQAFGAWEDLARRTLVLEGALDKGAAIAHEMYGKAVSAMSRKDLEAAAKRWEDIPETYRNANRASADSAPVKLWDMGFAPASSKKTAGRVETIEPEAALMDQLAEREHDRWVAERLMSGWRPGPERNNELRVHPMIKPFADLSEAEVDKDREQVRAAIAILRALHPNGFTPRPSLAT